MTSIQSENEERKSLLIQFVVFFVICVLCITVPMYYLFGIADKDLSKLSSPKTSEKEEKIIIQQMDSLTKNLQSYINVKYYKVEYTTDYKKLYALVENQINQSNVYKPFLLKMAKLYETVEETYDPNIQEQLTNKKADYDKLEQENKDLKEKKENADKELAKCQMSKSNLN